MPKVEGADERTVGAALRVFIVKTSFTDCYHDILYTFYPAVGAVGTVEKLQFVFPRFPQPVVFQVRFLADSRTAVLSPVRRLISRTVRCRKGTNNLPSNSWTR